jgi:hypothetical protein
MKAYLESKIDFLAKEKRKCDLIAMCFRLAITVVVAVVLWRIIF